MVSWINMTAYIFNILIVLAVAGILYFLLHSKIKMSETGMPGAIGYGIAGYLWGSLLLPIVIIAVLGTLKIFSGMQQNVFPVYILFMSVFNAIFTLLANVWGIFLTNQKQKSLYRSSTVGLGFGFANAAILVGISLYTAILMNGGKVTGLTSEEITAFVNTSPVDIVASGIQVVMVMIFYTFVAMILGPKINAKDWKGVILYGLLYYAGLHLVLKLLEIIPNSIYPYISIVVMLAIGIFCFREIQKELLLNEEK